VFGIIGVGVSAAVFAGPLIETRRRAVSVRTATESPTAAGGGYQELVEAEQRRAHRIAALMTGRSDRATTIVEEAFARLLEHWTRLGPDRRSWYVLSTVVKGSIGDAFVDKLAKDAASSEPADRMQRAARALSALEPRRRAIVVLSQSEGFKPDEIAALVGLDAERVDGELAEGLRQLGPVLAAVAA
jgi:RNA polymerase sigma factor (sigma-70 family)